ELEYVTGVFDTVEVNGTFYRLTTARAARGWYEAAPDDFVYAVKGSRFITHNKKLADSRGPLANFLAAGVLELADKLGPVLWQLPENLHFDPDRLRGFLELLPSSLGEAAELARDHDDRVKDPGLGPDDDTPLRHALEVRHDSFLTEESVELLRHHGVALAFSHSSVFPYVEELTADFVYLRLHGPGQIYESAYGKDALEGWAERIEAWHEGGEPDEPVRISEREPPSTTGRDVYVYFDNDVHAHAPREARALREMTG
ncbi:MAG: DUF72 domain-containing protein, partial [Actinomycetota bacterium]